jgi:hypothetical protein
MTHTSRTVLWWVVDRIFPLEQPLSPEEQKAILERRTAEQNEWEARTAALAGKEESLAQYLAACKTALDDEYQRRQSVDARLTTIIGLSSIAGTIVFGTILTKGSLHWLILLFLVYLTLQLASAMLAGVRGLERRSYDAMSSTDILPSSNEAPTDHFRRQIQQYFRFLIQHQDQNNAKVTKMAVAHCAIKNFIVGFLILAVLAGLYRFETPTSDELVNRLRNDHALYELLRGPRGQTGPAGPPGPAYAPAAPTANTKTPASSNPPQKR